MEFNIFFSNHKFKIPKHHFTYLKESNITFLGLRLLGYVMTFLAGAINAGGFFAIKEYTSHMSGHLASMSEDALLYNFNNLWYHFLMILSFIIGSIHASWTIIWAKRHRYRSSYGISLWSEAIYLILFGLLAERLNTYNILIPITAYLLCFIMGMHNTVMSILSNGILRTTHMTGVITDIGIELSKVFYYRKTHKPKVPEFQVNKPKIKLFTGMILCFIVGGYIGCVGFDQFGYKFVIPVALCLFLVGLNSIKYDVMVRYKIFFHKYYGNYNKN